MFVLDQTSECRENNSALLLLGYNEDMVLNAVQNSHKCVLITSSSQREWADSKVLALCETVDVASLDDFEEVLCALLRRGVQDICGAWTNRENSVVTTAALCDLFGWRGLSTEVAARFRDKFLQKGALRGTAKVAEFSLLGDLTRADAQMSWPRVLKPVSGAATRHTEIIGSQEEFEIFRSSLKADSAQHGTFMAEEVVDFDEELHIDGWVCDGSLQGWIASTYGLSALAVRQGKLLGYTSLDRRSHSAVYEVLGPWVEIVLKTLGLNHGVFHLECFARLSANNTVSSVTFGECAARVGGGAIAEGFEAVSGLSLFGVASQLTLGKRPSSRVPETGACASLHLPPTSASVPDFLTWVKSLDGFVAMKGIDADVSLERMKTDTTLRNGVLSFYGETSEQACSRLLSAAAVWAGVDLGRFEKSVTLCGSRLVNR